MSTGKDPKSMPQTLAFDEGYERIFGKKTPERGRWVQDPITGKLIPVEEYVPPDTALNAPIMVDRFYEGATTTILDDKNQPLKVDIGTRLRHREFMRQQGLTTADDYNKPGGEWAKAAAERAKIRAGEPIRDPERREQLGRISYELEKRRRK